MSARLMMVLAVSIALVISALGVVYAKHQTRILFGELQKLQSERDRMNVDWGRLQLEQGALATYQRIDEIAQEKMAMNLPQQETVVIVGSGKE